MKAKIIFSLPDDEVDFLHAVKASDYHSVLWDYAQYLRSQIKHNPYNISNEQIDAIEDCQTKFIDFLNKYNVNLE